MAERDLDGFVDEYHRALDAFFSGDAEPVKTLYSHEADASLANPFGPIAVGWEQVEKTMEHAASNYRDGRATSFDTVATYVTPALAYLVELERFEAKIGEQEESASGALRVTSILRLEAGAWRIVHRHADPITTPRAAESVIER
jgi:ketosteroid isomerase-like protein